MDDEELLALKRHLVRFFADRIALASEEIWDKKQWKTEDTEQLRQRHLRIPYRKAWKLFLMIQLTEQQYAQLQQTVLEMSQKLEEWRTLNTSAQAATHKKDIVQRLYGILAVDATCNDKDILADEVIKKHLG